MSRSAATEKHWPTETPEQMLARVEKEHGPRVAATVARILELEAETPKRLLVGPNTARRGEKARKIPAASPDSASGAVLVYSRGIRPKRGSK